MFICNVDRFLAEAIDSILCQTFTDLESIIVDFGSTDTSKVIASSYVAKDSRPRCSLVAAGNASWFLVQGRYIAIRDADDIALPNRVRRESDFMEKNPDRWHLGCCYCMGRRDGQAPLRQLFPG
jgi:glycosyltransferase involved in cell wall biosynthesis